LVIPLQCSSPTAFLCAQATQQRPFKLACDERAALDHMRLGEEALMGTEERAVRTVGVRDWVRRSLCMA
jgi:hypothetical protein